ncbi:MAG: MFS transporter [Steroidobacteraceae bacterium]
MLDGTDMLIMSFIAPVLSENWAISPERLGLLFSASLAGMAFGCLLIAPLADRFGRRAMIAAALAVVAAAMVLSAFSRNVPQLMVARLFVGTGVGTIGVSMTAMAAEYAPKAHANFAVGFVQAGWPLGSILTAILAAKLLPAHDWQSLLVGIGVLSAGLFLVILVLLPESLGDAGSSMALRVPALFASGRAWPSALLWSAVALSYFVLYFAISWIPKLVTQAGLPLTEAIYAGATYNLGAFLGTAAVGWIAIRYRLNEVIASFLGAAAIAMLVFGGLSMPVWLTLLAAACVGVTVQGGFNGYWALAARLYPAGMRSTGIGWALGVGRVGAVLGPIAGGLLVGARVPMAMIFAIFAMAAAAAAAVTLRIRVD